MPSNPYQSVSKSQDFVYEFGGPIGALLTTVSLPPLVLVLTYYASIGHITLDWREIYNHGFHHDLNIFLNCFMSLGLWFLFQVLCERCLPYELVPGAILPEKDSTQNNITQKKATKDKTDLEPNRLLYRINGHLAFWLTLSILVCFPYLDPHGRLQFRTAPLHLIYDYYGDLALAAIVWCTLLSFYLYISSFHGDKLLAKGGNSGNPFYDFFMGRELNPRLRNIAFLQHFDWKEFCELRPGLIGWVVLNLAFATVQKSKLGYVSGSMIVLNLFQGLYVWDALYQEKAILTTMDITTDGFGFMLAFGDMAWVPFTYSLQARYLVDYDPHLSLFQLCIIIAVNFTGYRIFRGANSQKDLFRTDPNHELVKSLSYLQTKRGTRLLTSGYWGLARKINYTGDWIMGLSWCLLCGFDSIVPYFYAIYFCILLIHRSERDDHMCHVKYGDDWLVYKNVVPYRFIPGVI